MKRPVLYGITIVLCLLHMLIVVMFEASPPTWICHDDLRRCMKDLHDVCEEEGIPYWIHSGTLLGSVRGGDIISFDDDIDISIHEHDIDRLSDACHRNGMGWGSVYSGLYRVTNDKKHIFIDVFPVHVEGDKLMYSGIARLLFDESFLVTDTFSTKYNLGRIKVGATFLPLVLNGPDDAETYLTNTYGPDWTVPKSILKIHTFRGIRDSYVYSAILGTVSLILVVLFVSQWVQEHREVIIVQTI